MEFFHQDLFEKANLGNGRDPEYLKLRAYNLNWAQSTLNTLLQSGVDLLLGCSYGPAWLSTLGEGDTFADATWITMAPARSIQHWIQFHSASLPEQRILP